MDGLPKQLQNHKEKCRCCFSFLKPLQKTVNISKSIENRFYMLTNIKLIISDLYSNVICESCNSKLSEFADFQSELIDNQTSLYDNIFVESNEAELEETEEEICRKEFFVDVTQEQRDVNIVEEFIVNVKAKEEFSLSKITESVRSSEQNIDAQNTEIIHENQHKWHCSICNIVFQTRSLLQSHKRSHRQPRGDQKIKRRKMCQICGLSFATASWYHHVLRAHTENFRFLCDFCGKGFRIKNDLKTHLNTHISIESRQKFECSFCNSTFLSKNALKNHFQIFHSEVIEEHPCDCGKIFSSRMKLVQHRLSVHSKESVKCPHCPADCERTFKSKDTLRKHINKGHKQKDPCSICGKMYTPGMFMKQHLKSHDTPQLKCDVDGCSKKFHRTSQLNHHKVVSHSSIEFTCETCCATFKGARNLSRHIARQHGSLRIACAVEGCEHSAARKDYLAAHYRAHKDIDEETKKYLLERVKDIKVIPW